MSEKKYDNMKHLEGALRRVYQARTSLSHIDAGLLEPNEFEVVREAVETCKELEDLFESRIHKDRQQGRYEWPPAEEPEVVPSTVSSADD